jgi:predicted nucleic acid-binding protein
MQVVSNTSPLSNLAIIGRLDLLKRRYGRVMIPSAVLLELQNLSHSRANARIAAALTEGWLITATLAAAPPQSSPSLDAGENEAIALALSTHADVLLMDERRGREVARRHGLTVAGVLGELLHARQNGLLPDLRREINRLRSEAGFFVGAQIEAFILSQAGE